MARLDDRTRTQDAVLWPFAGSYAADGRPQCNTPVDVQVRWNTIRREATDPQGNTVMLTAEAVVDRVIDPGAVMFLGSYEDFLGTGSGSGLDDSELHQVITYQEMTDLRGREMRRTVGLMRFRDATPTVV